MEGQERGEGAAPEAQRHRPHLKQAGSGHQDTHPLLQEPGTKSMGETLPGSIDAYGQPKAEDGVGIQRKPPASRGPHQAHGNSDIPHLTPGHTRAKGSSSRTQTQLSYRPEGHSTAPTTHSLTEELCPFSGIRTIYTAVSTLLHLMSGIRLRKVETYKQRKTDLLPGETAINRRDSELSPERELPDKDFETATAKMLTDPVEGCGTCTDRWGVSAETETVLKMHRLVQTQQGNCVEQKWERNP